MIDLGTINFNLLLQVIPYYSSSASYKGSNLFCGPDDDSCVLFTNNLYLNYVSSYPLYIYVVDISGSYTWYAVPGYGVNSGVAIENIIPYGRSIFLLLLSNGLVYWFSPQNAKLNNTTPISVFPSQALPQVCGQSPQNIFYDPVKQILIAGYYYPAGQNGTFINSVAYSISARGYLNQVAAGYAGYADPPNTLDPFDLTSSGLGADIGVNWIQTNGLNGGYGSVNQDQIILASSSYDVNPGAGNSIVCPGSQNFPPPVNGANVTNRVALYETLPAPIIPWYSVTTVYPSDTTIPGLILLNTSGASYPVGGPFVVFGNNFYASGLINYPPNANFSSFHSLALTKKYLFGAYSNGNQGGDSLTIISAVPNPGLANGSNVFRQAYATINNTRPVSISGRYRT
ncbi:MAG: hypothetical protein ACP5QA_10420 [Phycisphaerae bacterium]